MSGYISARQFVSIAAYFLVLAVWSGIAAGQAGLERSGSGFIVNDRGWVMTNRHVVEGCHQVRLRSGEVAVAVIEDELADLALVYVPDAAGRSYLSFRAGGHMLAEEVAALGFPLSDVLSSSIKVTLGSVSGFGGVRDDVRMFQFSAPVQPGNSGGPVIGRDGTVIGVITSVLSDQVTLQPQNVNFATETAEAVRLLEQVGVPYSLATHSDQRAEMVQHVDVSQHATVPIHCFGAGSSIGTSPQSVAERVEPPSADPILEAAGVDYVGFDYRAFEARNVGACRAACLDDQRCTAYTFNTAHDYCFLKENARVTVRNADAIGGILRWRADDVIHTDFVITSNEDSPGGDYRSIASVGFVECFVECAVDLRCRAFAFVREQRACWLKDRVGPVGPMSGVDFGRR